MALKCKDAQGAALYFCYRGGGDFAQHKFRWTNFVTRKTHQIFPVRNLSGQKSSAPSAPLPLFFMYFLMGPEKKTHKIY